MKKLFLSIAFMMLSVVSLLAQTPLEVIQFYKAFSDVPIVNKAAQQKNWTSEFVQYVIDDSNPMDVRMAVVNAIGVGKEAASISHAITSKPSDYVAALYGYAVAMEYYKSESQLDAIIRGLDSEIKSEYRSLGIIRNIIYAQLHPNEEGADFVRDACYNRYAGGEYDVKDKALELICQSLKSFENLRPPVTLRISSRSSNPYKLEINGQYITTIEGRGDFRYDCKAGYYHIKATQISGYAFYPTVNEKDIQAVETEGETNYYDIEIGY